MILNRMNASKRISAARPAIGIAPCRNLDDSEFNSRCDEMKQFYRDIGRFPHDTVSNAGTREY